jgi:hypothetical protein
VPGDLWPLQGKIHGPSSTITPGGEGRLGAFGPASLTFVQPTFVQLTAPAGRLCSFLADARGTHDGARPRLGVTVIGRKSPAVDEREDAKILEEGTDRSVSSRKPEVRWLDVPTIAASLMAVLTERRAAFARTE